MAARGQAPAGPPGEEASRQHLGDQPPRPRTADSLAGRETFNVGKQGNLHTENITSVAQFARALDESSTRIPGTDEPLTAGQMRDGAEEMGLNPEDLDLAKLQRAFGGVKNLGKKVLAFRRAIREQAERVGDLMQRVADTDDDRVVAEYARERTTLMGKRLGEPTPIR